METKILRRKTTIEEYSIYRAALEWDLTDPIVIKTREDIKSAYRWQDLVDPYEHQVKNLITFCRRLPVTLLADDVGLGKTISAGVIISELIVRLRVSKVLIVCPKLLGPQWQEELQTKFRISSKIATGREFINADLHENGAVITTYHSARDYLYKIPEDRYQMLVLDEAHKLKNLFGVPKTPQVAIKFRKALEARRFRFVLMLTATPIQNKLWDIYSLVDLLAVARGHENPFGTKGEFAHNFIKDSPTTARKLKETAREKFRAIVYAYMSRVRRGDANLSFPDRVVKMHKAKPTQAELDLIRTIAEPIQDLNRLTQISILQALVSSPEALMAQLNRMAKKGTAPLQLAEDVRKIVLQRPISAKLHGLGVLIETLKLTKADWRLVIFTGRLETQTRIRTFMEAQDIKVGIINGASGPRNQETIERFRENPPELRVIVSTEAGSEGINLQVANVFVNYDLPWNPMIVEQRIGRVQRLASEHASVSVFNITLSGTFEEYIVGRLMEKLQMVSHAIGDIESLLDAAGINDDNGQGSFEEKICELVIASLAGKDVKEATRMAEESITKAKEILEEEKENIDRMLGGMDQAEYDGPMAPDLPSFERSMNLSDFTLAAFKSLGAHVTPQPHGVYLVEEGGIRQYIYFEENASAGLKGTAYNPSSPAFLRLVSRIIETGLYDVDDLDRNPKKESKKLAHQWVLNFDGNPDKVEFKEVQLCFEGNAVVRVRATVAHDSYERLVDVSCSPDEHNNIQAERLGFRRLPDEIENPSVLGINLDKLEQAARDDEAISEFSRFYLERRAQEMKAAGDDERKREKLENDFTPRLTMSLVAVKGELYREVKLKAKYLIDDNFEYDSILTVTPHTGELNNVPEMGRCALSGKIVPETCLNQCQVTGIIALQHLLAQCEFTKAKVLNTELAVSEVSGRRYRRDEQMCSVVSGKRGHKSEFLICYETRQPILFSEAEQCEISGNYVRKGILEQCEVSQKRVLPSELERCAVTGKRVLKKFLVISSLSERRFLEEIAIRSATEKYCTPLEAKSCFWSGRKCHPDDLRVCNLTGLSIHFEYATRNNPRLHPLVELLNGINRTADNPQIWNALTINIAEILGRSRDQCRVESAILSPDEQSLAVCSEVRTWWGLKIRQAGFVYSISNNCVIGSVVQGQRTSEGWSGARV